MLLPLLVWIIINKANNPLTLAFILRLSFNIYWWFFIIGHGKTKNYH